MTSLREARKARAREVRRGFFDIVAVSPAEYAAAKAAAAAAQSEADKATGKAREGANERLRAAREAFEATYHRQWFEQIPYTEAEAIRAAHLPKPKAEREPGYLSPRIPALIAAMAVEVDASGKTVGRCEDTAEDWAADLEQWPEADLNALLVAVEEIQSSPASAELGKG